MSGDRGSGIGDRGSETLERRVFPRDAGSRISDLRSPHSDPPSIHDPRSLIPLLDLQAQYLAIRGPIMDAIARVCESQRFILGPEVDALETELAALLRVKHAIGVSSGTDALLMSLMALGIGPRDEVVTTPYSFFATAGAIARLGATPRFVDIDPLTFNIDPGGIARVLTSRTKAIMPVHLFGQPADLDPIVQCAADAGVPIIEDAAQAISARYKRREVGGIGAIGCFSFFPSKNLGAFGDAGLVTTNDDAVADTLRRLRQHGGERRYYHEIVGGNFRIDALQAAVLRVKTPYLAGWTEARRANAARYNRLFARAMSEGAMPVVLPVEMPDRYHIYNQYVIRTPQRDALRAHLEKQGIGTAIYYPVPLHLQACFAGLAYKAGDFPHAEQAALDTLALPIYSELTEAQQAFVVSSIAQCFAG